MEAIIKGKADCLLCAKDNQQSLKKILKALFLPISIEKIDKNFIIGYTYGEFRRWYSNVLKIANVYNFFIFPKGNQDDRDVYCYFLFWRCYKDVKVKRSNYQKMK